MTRWARGHNKEPLPASTWQEMKRKSDAALKVESELEEKKAQHISATKERLLATHKFRKGQRSKRFFAKAENKQNELEQASRNKMKVLSDMNDAKPEKKAKVCLNCREPGHKIKSCPKRKGADSICFKCGSNDHQVSKCRRKIPKNEFPFAKCFICKETGHLSSACPDNPRGLYPHGGGCKFCGSVEHLGRDCSERISEKSTKSSSDAPGKSIKLAMNDSKWDCSADAIDLSDNSDVEDVTPKPKKPKIVKF